jgi:hypothetical protein
MNLSPSTFTQIGSTRLVELGHRLIQDTTDRAWHYSRDGGSGLVKGKLDVSATQDAQRVGLSFAVAPAAGDKKVKVTIGTGNASANDYQDGWLVVQSGTGAGDYYPIEGHPPITASTAGYFYLKEPIRTAGALAETNVDLIKNRWDDVVISVADQADPVVGVANVTVTASYYAWLQTWGACSVLQDETTAAGSSIVTGTGTVGAVEAFDYNSGERQIGVMGPKVAVDGGYQLVWLEIAR